MTRHQRFLIIISIITCYLIQAQGADKYTDENRPYKFGFVIDGEQHRYEEKDKNGIIKGEYGFITADGVYHITVYATDEQGRFKILSMKNIRYADYRGLTGTSTSARQGHSLQLPSPQAVATHQPPTTTSIATPKPQQEFESISLEPPVNSCSHCSLPKTTTIAPKPQTPLINQQSNSGNSPNNVNSQYTPSFYPKQETNSFGQAPQEQSPYKTEINNQQGVGPASNVPSRPSGYNGAQQQATNAPTLANNNYEAQNIGQTPNVPAPANYYNGAQNIGQSPNAPSQQNNYNIAQNSGQPPNGSGQQIFNNLNSQTYNLQAPQASLGRQQGAAQKFDNADRTRTAKQYSGTVNEYTSGQPNSANDINAPQAIPNPNKKPVLAYAQMQIVDKNTDIHAKRPGEKDGLPPGLKEEDMLKLLYTFNYTLGFQAHFEEGYRNGEKRGYYYTTGRNGVRTRIDYVADKDGFRPTLSQEVFDLLSDDVPKEETEKEEKYGLKGYEFKWLYFPEENSSQSKAT